MKLIVFISILLISYNCFSQEKDALNYIGDYAVPIDTNIDDLKDLAKIKEEFVAKRIVSVGEATHGTHEFQVTKFKIFKYLVTELHYKIFGIEAGFAESLKVNDYILNGRGDPKMAIRGMRYWMWSNKDFLKMVEWMRTYNLDKPLAQKVKFYGFDLQLDAAALELISNGLKKLDSNYFNKHFSDFPSLHIAYAKLQEPDKYHTQVLLNDLKSYINSQESNLLKLFNKDEVAYLKQSLEVLQQCFDLNANTNDMIASMQKRDKYMAKNVQWILNFEGTERKAMLWAHNSHISKANSSFGENMGMILMKIYGDEYYAIGFDFNRGSFKAADLRAQKNKVFTVGAAYKGSTGRILSNVAIPEFFIEIKKAAVSKIPTGGFFTQKLRMRSVGLNFDPKNESEFYTNGVLDEMYDALIFVNETTSIVGLDQ